MSGDDRDYGVTATEHGWGQTLEALALGDLPSTVLDEEPPGAGTRAARIVGATIGEGDDDRRWGAIEQAALRQVEQGGFLVLRAPRRTALHRVPADVSASWTARLERLMAAGFSIHRRDRRSASFRRDRMNVLYLAPWLTFGGSDKGTLDWLQHMPKDTFRLYLHTTQPSENPLYGIAEPLAEEAWCLPDLMPGTAMPQFIVNFVATRNIDVLHIMNSRLGFDLLPALKAAFPHLRVVVQLHVEEEDRSGYCRFVTTRYGNLVDAFSVTSEDLRDKLLRYHVSPSKLKVIYTGLDLREFDPDRPRVGDAAVVRRKGQGLDILFAARLTAQKDPLLMVRVAAALRDVGSESVIHVVGDGELRHEVESAVTAEALDDRVLFHGPSYDMWSWYRSTDVTLLTSSFEGMPFVVFEALGMARPVVAPDLGGTREVVDGEVGFLVQRRDRVDEYVAALVQLERRPELLTSLGRAGRRRMLERFSVGHMAQGHAALYRRLAARYAVEGLLG